MPTELPPLTFLSLQRCARGVCPEAYSNEDRRKVFQQHFTPNLDNHRVWPHHQIERERMK